MADYADLEISLRRYDISSYLVDLRFNHPDSDADIRLISGGSPALAQFDVDHLRTLVLQPHEYGKYLSSQLFADANVLTTFSQAFASAQSLDVPLRIRLFIGPDAPELHQIHWETLYHPHNDTLLLTSEQTLFSRYLSSTDWRPVKLRPKSDLRALVVVANPADLGDYEPGGAPLAALDVDEEIDIARDALGDTIPITTLASNGSATLSGIISHLRDGYDILYLVAHGALLKGEAFLWLEDEDGNAAVTSGKDVVARIKDLSERPRLVVLSSCQSAGDGGSGAGETGTQQSLANHALGPRLAEAGIPAVLAMQGNVSMATTNTFMPTFFEELLRDGQVDRAMAAARKDVLDRPDWWLPVLIMRLKSGRIWYVPGFGEDGQDFEKWPALMRNIQRGNCTPIIGPRLTQSLLESPDAMTVRIAEAYHFPLAPHERQELPTVSQYLAISQDTLFPREEFLETIRLSLVERYGDRLAADVDQEDMATMFAATWQIQAHNNPTDPYKVLASLPFPIYITANFSNLLVEALRTAGKEPQVEICRWNEDIESLPSVFDDDPEYQPDADHPLVFHVFGYVDELDSLVMTQDDYFDFLIQVSMNRDLIPIPVRRALADTGLLFLGFELQDWGFRVLYRSLMSQEGRSRRKRYAHIAAQLSPDEEQNLDPNRARRYLEEYFGGSDVDIFWGNTEDFMKELHQQQQQAPAERERGSRMRRRR